MTRILKYTCCVKHNEALAYKKNLNTFFNRSKKVSKQTFHCFIILNKMFCLHQLNNAYLLPSRGRIFAYKLLMIFFSNSMSFLSKSWVSFFGNWPKLCLNILPRMKRGCWEFKWERNGLQSRRVIHIALIREVDQSLLLTVLTKSTTRNLNVSFFTPISYISSLLFRFFFVP